MLTLLRDKEPGLCELIVAHVAPIGLHALVATCKWLRETAIASADLQVIALMQNDRRVSRWRREPYLSKPVDVLLELQHIVGAASYAARVAGRYRLAGDSILDIAPSGDFVNYSRSSTNEGHCFRGIMTVAGVRPRGRFSEPLYLLDRWYVACWRNGESLPAESLSFVGPGYQCFSVSTMEAARTPASASASMHTTTTPATTAAAAAIEAASMDAAAAPRLPPPPEGAMLYENEPGPDSDIAWKVPQELPVLRWTHEHEQSGVGFTMDSDEAAAIAEELRALLRLKPSEGRPLRPVAERLCCWPVGGLVPLVDTAAATAMIEPLGAMADAPPAPAIPPSPDAAASAADSMPSSSSPVFDARLVDLRGV